MGKIVERVHIVEMADRGENEWLLDQVLAQTVLIQMGCEHVIPDLFSANGVKFSIVLAQ